MPKIEIRKLNKRIVIHTNVVRGFQPEAQMLTFGLVLSSFFEATGQCGINKTRIHFPEFPDSDCEIPNV